MKTNIKYILAAFTLVFSSSAFAQLQSSYFMEGSLYRHELNPAFGPEQSYFSFPLLGNFNVGVYGNIGVKDVLFNRNNRTVTFLHPDVSLSDALSGINEKNKLFTSQSMPILSVGFKGLGGANTISFKVRSFEGIFFGDDIFHLLKDLKNENYNIGGIGAQAELFTEVGIGHSHRINENWRVGGKLKFLLGLARMNAELTDLSLNLQNPNEWTATAHANVEANVTGLEIITKHASYNDESKNTLVDPKTGERYGYDEIDDFDYNFDGLGGWGLALDLGAEYDFKDIAPGLKASISFVDLGFIRWSESHVIENNGEKFTFDGFNNIRVKDGDGTDFDDQTDDLGDDIEKLYRLENKGDIGASTHGIGATMHIGVEYALPMYDKVRFGLLSTTRFQGDYTWNEERLSVNYAPCNWFDMNINGGIGTLGASFGWMLNLHPVGFNLFLGMDHMLGSLSKQGIPLNTNSDFTIGVNFPLTKAPKKNKNI